MAVSQNRKGSLFWGDEKTTIVCSEGLFWMNKLDARNPCPEF